MYPNALYAQVNTNYDANTITLVQGHGYPDPKIKNGFGWQQDNSEYKYDITCNTWNVYKSANYSMLNCYPEFALLHDVLLLHIIRDQNPAHFSDDIKLWSKNPHDRNYTSILLHNYDISANHIPQWVHICADLLENNKISQLIFSIHCSICITNHYLPRSIIVEIYSKVKKGRSVVIYKTLK